MAITSERQSWPARAAHRLEWEARSIAGSHPSLFLPLARARHRRGDFRVPIQGDTEVVIEAFPRSGLTFTVVAFAMAQGRDVRMAHHLHAPAQAIAGARAGIPTMVVVREPQEAVLSLVIRLPHLSIRQALRSYARFHRALVPHLGGMVVGRFEEATANPGALTARLNERFGTAFEEFEPSDANLRRALVLVEESDRSAFGDGPILDRVAARPSAVRDRLKDSLRAAYRSPSLRGPRARAEAAHARCAWP